MTDESAVPDTAAVVAEIREEVERQRAAGTYPAALMDRLSTEFRPDESSEPPEALLQIASSRSLRSTRPVVGGAIVAGKKVVRRLLAWYVAPIAADQTRFNIAILRDMRALERRLERAATPWAPIPGAPPGDAWGGPDGARLVEARVAAAAGVLERTGRDAPVVAGAGAPYATRFAAHCPRARFVDGDPLVWLEAVPRASERAIVLAGVLDRLSAAELLRVMPLCAAALEPGGIAIADGIDPLRDQRPAPGGVRDPTLRRAIGAETMRVLAEAAGFAGFDREAASAGEWYVAWATLP